MELVPTACSRGKDEERGEEGKKMGKFLVKRETSSGFVKLDSRLESLTLLSIGTESANTFAVYKKV